MEDARSYLIDEQPAPDLLPYLKGRRSIRKFKPQSVPRELIDKIMEAGTWAPSAGNVQPWYLYLIFNRELKQRLAQAALEQRFVGKAPLVIVVCADKSRAQSSYGIRGETLYCIQDTASMVQNMLLETFSLGLGGCWVGAFREEDVKAALDMPHHLQPVAILPIGYPDEKPGPRTRRDWRETVKVIE
ncbi:MAG: nitroreductase family protein [bacterium]